MLIRWFKLEWMVQSVNWKLLDMIKQDCCDKNPQGPKMLRIGSCGVHVIPGAFRTAKSGTDWNLKKF